MKWENDAFGLVLRMRQMVYSSKDFESLWFLYQAEGLPKDISIEEFFAEQSVLKKRLLHKARVTHHMNVRQCWDKFVPLPLF